MIKIWYRLMVQWLKSALSFRRLFCQSQQIWSKCLAPNIRSVHRAVLVVRQTSRFVGDMRLTGCEEYLLLLSWHTQVVNYNHNLTGLQLQGIGLLMFPSWCLINTQNSLTTSLVPLKSLDIFSKAKSKTTRHQGVRPVQTWQLGLPLQPGHLTSRLVIRRWSQRVESLRMLRGA